MKTGRLDSALPVSGRRIHPAVFGILYFPFGLAVGYPAIAVGYLARQAGLPVSAIAGVLGSALLPHTLKFFWAPVGDLTLSRKRWYVVAVAVVAVLLALATAIPIEAKRLPLLTAILVGANLATTFVAFAVEGLMAHNVAEAEKGRAAGWFQAGNQIGQTLGGGIGLWLLTHLPHPWHAGMALGAILFGCTLVLPLLENPPAVHGGSRVAHRVGGVGREVWEVLRTRGGTLGALLAILPIGTAASQYLFAPMAGEWHASADIVTFVVGLGGGLAIALGCVLGGRVADYMPRQMAYAVTAGASIATALLMAYSPRTPTSYAVTTLLYIFVNGACQASLSGMVFGLVGVGATATKVNLYIALNTLGGLTTVRLAGGAHDRWGATGVLLFEVVAGATALLVFAAVASGYRQARQAPRA